MRHSEKLNRLGALDQTNYDDGSRYVGELKEGRKHGNGILYVPDGAVYLGQWEGDNYHGQGTYIHPDG